MRATDAAGNTDLTSAVYNWVIDLIPPETNITSGPTDPTNLTDASFDFTSTEAGSTFQCSLDGGVYADCTSPKIYAGLAEGNRTFSVRATDIAGNTDLTPAVYNWVIDLTPPDTNITSGPVDPTNLTDASFDFTSTEAGSTFQCSLDGGAYVDCTSIFSYTGLASGSSHTFNVQATDAAGNTDPTPASHNWFINIDGTPPNPTSIVINRNAQYAIVVDELSAQLTALDNVGVTAYLITEHNASDSLNIVPPYLDPLPSDGRWVTVTETASFSASIQFPLVQTYSLGDTVELCAWYMDAQGYVSARVCDSIVLGTGWEGGWGNWYADNGVWQVGGSPTAGPGACYSGTQCAGTVLDGNYPDFVDSRLVSPSIQLSALALGEELQLRFWHWFSINSWDALRVQIREEVSPGVWGAWATETSYSLNSGGVWTRPLVDLSAYADKKVQIGFLLDNHGSFGGVDAGWYVDDITIVVF